MASKAWNQTKSKRDPLASLSQPAALTFLTMPTEIRLNIYNHVFGVDTAVLDFQLIDGNHRMIGRNHTYLLHKPRPTGILLASRSIYTEARPVLFAHTTFVVNKYADFHQLPWATCCLDQPWMIKHISWTITTNDLQRRWNNGDLSVTQPSFPGLENLEMHCSAPNWESTPVAGIKFSHTEGRAKMLQLAMEHVDGVRFNKLVEEIHGKGQNSSEVGKGSCGTQAERGFLHAYQLALLSY